MIPMILGQTELLIVFLIIVILFGSSKLPELARSMGKAKSEYKKGATEGEEEIEQMNVEQQPPETQQAATPAAPTAPEAPAAPVPETPTEEPKQE
ncbi:MAG: twin-arginine translocase TatA/TatE family subunit [Candidatus Hydrothermarchaeales archaeon]